MRSTILAVTLFSLLSSLLASSCGRGETHVAEQPTSQVKADNSPETPRPSSEAETEARRDTPGVVSTDKPPSAPLGGYYLTVEPDLLADKRLRISIHSNLPGVIEVMAGVSLQGQEGDDVWIGKNERVRLKDGEGSVTFSTAELPAGIYDVEADFYPRWGPQDSVARSAAPSKEIHASKVLHLTGSGASAKDVQIVENGQRWVMMNVAMGDPWNASEWIERFGPFRELSIDQGNPRILKAYYFSRIDTTLIVNVLKREIVIWRLGQAHH